MALTLETIPTIQFSGNPIWVNCKSDLVVANNKALVEVKFYDRTGVTPTTYSFVLDFDSDNVLKFNVAPVLDKAMHEWRKWAPWLTGDELFQSQKDMIRLYEVEITDDYIGETGTLAATGPLFVVKGSISHPFHPHMGYWENYLTLGEETPLLTYSGYMTKRKYVMSGQPEYLSMLVKYDSELPSPLNYPHIKVEAFDTSDDSLGTTTFDPLDITSGPLYQIIIAEVNPDIIMAAFDPDVVKYYDCWFTDSETGDRISAKMRYIVDRKRYFNTRHFVFVNSLGGWDTITFNGAAVQTLSIESTVVGRSLQMTDDNLANDPTKGDQFDEAITGRNIFKVKSPVNGRYTKRHLQEFFLSKQRLLFDQQRFVPIRITSSKVTLVDEGESVQVAEFEFEKAFNETGFTPEPLNYL